MNNKCPCCGKEKGNIGPKIIGKAKSNDPRLRFPNDVLLTKVMCNDCYDPLKKSDELAQKCLNPACESILFISGKMDPDIDMRGVDRDIKFHDDSKGYFIECPKCGTKHNIEIWKGPEGSGGQWKVNGLRK
jgi:hypothetical protein